MEGSEAISDVLGVIRVKDSIAAMDDRPRFKRIYGTDIDSENTRDNEWQELMARHRIKQRLQLAKTRRMSKIKEMEKTIASSLTHSEETSSSPEPVKRKPSKSELLEEYRAMKGKSISMKSASDISEGEKDGSKLETQHQNSDSGKTIRTDTAEKHTEESPRPATTFISAIIETPMTRVEDNEGSQGNTSKGRQEGEGNSAHEDNSDVITNTEDIDEKNSNDKEGKYDDMKKSETGENEERKGEIIREDKVEINKIKKPKENGQVENNETDDGEKTFSEEENEDGVEEIEKINDSGVNLNEISQAEESPKVQKKRVKQKKKTKVKSKTNEKSKTKQEKLETKEQNAEESTTKVHSENSNKVQTRWKKTARKALPLSEMCSKLRERMSEENEKQMDLLETIRILRGISRYEFYKDLSIEGSDFESDSEETTTKMESPNSSQLQSQVRNEQGDNEALLEEEEEKEKEEIEIEPHPPIVVVEKREDVHEQNHKKRLISRVDSRWPAGHRYHTKPVEQKYLSIYLKPIHSKLQTSKIDIHALPRTAKEITEYLKWREKLLEIAYLNEFSHLRKMSLMSFTMPLPGIEPRTSPPFSVSSTNRNSSRSTSSASKHHRHEITFQQHSMLTIRGTKETERTGHSSKIIQDQRHIKRKITMENNCKHDNHDNPYLMKSKTRHKKRSKQTRLVQRDEKENQQELDFGFAGENELETLISKITKDSKRDVVEGRIKSQSTDSAINEPSLNSDDDDCDVMKSNIEVSICEKDRCQENGAVLLREERKTESKAFQKKKFDADFMQTVRLLRTGRYRYIQHVDPVKRTTTTLPSLSKRTGKQTS